MKRNKKTRRRRPFNPTHRIQPNDRPAIEVQLLDSGDAVSSESELPTSSMFRFDPNKGWLYRSGKPVVGVISKVH